MILAVVLALFLIPAAEIYVIVAIGGAIGAWPTVGLLALGCLAGAWLIRREGQRAWAALRDSLTTGRAPEREIADTPILMLGGVLLATPGFITDVFGLLVVLPPTRPLIRRMVRGYTARRMRRVTIAGGPFGPADPFPPAEEPPLRYEARVVRDEDPHVIRAEVTDTESGPPPSRDG